MEETLEDLSQLVRELRSAMGVHGAPLSQQEFSNRLGRSLSLIQRYEKGAGGVGVQELGKMVTLSREALRGDLATKFRAALVDALGQDSLAALIDPVPESQVQDPKGVTISEQEPKPQSAAVNSDTLSQFALTDEERGNVEALLYLLREGDPHVANAATGLLKPWFGRKLSAGDPAKAASSSNKGNSARTGRGDADRTKRAG